ncbi:methyl-accepting chemotaxis protein [Spirochaetia bacterium]|nr:methyl-accepting chemotaxis protein [Spirochaetia bacterium]
MKKEGKVNKNTSVKRQFLVFSVVLFLLIFAGGSVAFIVSMGQILHANAGNDLRQIAEIERSKLESSVNAEIAIALKMADSPVIQRYFLDPGDQALEETALAEIAGYRRAFASNTVFWVNDVDKKFYSDDAYVYTIDPGDPDSYWYHMTLNETETYNFNINYNADLKVTSLWINAPVFDSSHKPIGMLGTGINISTFIASIYQNYSGKAALYLFNAAGEITGARDAKLVESKRQIADELGARGAEIVSAAEKLPAGGGITVFNSAGGVTAVASVPALDWYITTILPLGTADYLNSPMTFFFAAVLIIVIVIFIIFNLFIRIFLKPLSGMVSALNQISTDWDLTRRLTIQRKDEIGILSELFNLTFEKMTGLIRSIKEKTAFLSGLGTELAGNMTESAAAVSQITSSIQSIKGRVINQSASVTETNATMEQITVNIDKLNDHVEHQSANVSQSSSAIEQMFANIRSVTQTLMQNIENVDQLMKASDAGRGGLQEVAADIQEIARESAGLLEINAVMENIASQTNLLSMNAAIEAAHAGEAGKGFAVVASEIRKLAESSSTQSKTIGAVLKKIKESIDKITVSTNNVLQKFEAIDSGVKTVAEQESNIRNAMEEQGEGSKQILEAVAQLSDITGQVKGGSEEMLTGSREVIQESRRLEKVTSEITIGMNEMSDGADHINTAVSRVNELSRQNRDNITVVVQELSRFKVN